MTFFVSGLLVMGYAVAAVFFLRFWRTSRDRLFLFFSAGFALLALQRTSLAAASLLVFPETAYYAIRLLAFLVILVGIIDKNRA
jgi:Family of unknown function (DUF5985)